MQVLDYRHKLGKQQGAALLVSMIMLIVLTILVLGSMRNAGLNARMAGNSQMFNTFKNTVDGEGFAQAGYFSAQAMASGADKLVNQAIITTEKYNANKIASTAPLSEKFTLITPLSSGISYVAVDDFDIKLIDMSKKLKKDYGAFKAGEFIHGSMCQGYGQAVGCNNMVIDIDAKNARPKGADLDVAKSLGLRSEQVLGFGIIGPKAEGAQAINTATP